MTVNYLEKVATVANYKNDNYTSFLIKIGSNNELPNNLASAAINAYHSTIPQ